MKPGGPGEGGRRGHRSTAPQKPDTGSASEAGDMGVGCECWEPTDEQHGGGAGRGGDLGKTTGCGGNEKVESNRILF